MKKISILFVLFFGFMINVYAQDSFEKYQVIPVTNLYNCAEMQGLSDLSFDEQMDWVEENWQDNWVIEVTKGIELPLNLNIKGDFFHLEPEDNYVSIFVDKTFYVRTAGEDDLLLSTDLITWIDIEEFFTGDIDVRYLDHNGKSFVNFLIELNQS